MDFEVVQNQKDFLGLVGDQLAEEFEEQGRVQGLLDKAEPDEALVADGRHQRQSRPAAGGGKHRRFPPVSYTHLDVYKRQIKNSALDINPAARLAHALWLIWIATEIDMITMP